MSIPVHEAVFGRTTLIRANILEILQFQRWPSTVQRNAVPENQTFVNVQLNMPKKNKPYRMQSILQSPLPRLTIDKILHDLQFIFTASLHSAGVVENITVMT